MVDRRMYEQDHYVVLEAGVPEQFLSAVQMLEKLKTTLAQRQDRLPQDLQVLPTIDVQAQHLLDTACELTLDPGEFLQWYAVRLEKP